MNYCAFFNADNQTEYLMMRYRHILSGAVVSLGRVALSVRIFSDNPVRDESIPCPQQNNIAQAGRADNRLYNDFPRWTQGITHTPTLDAKSRTPSAMESYS
jgi:hypothetical protein